MIHYTPIWDVLAAQGEREGAGEHRATRPRCPVSQLGKRCQLGLLGLGFAPGLVWGRFFMVKNLYIASYSVYTCNVPFNIHLGTREWVDGIR